MSKLPNSNNDTKERPPSTPRWVKISVIIVIILVLLFFLVKFTGLGGNHGPGRHIPGGEPTAQSDERPTENQGQKINNNDDGSHKSPEGDL